MPTPSERRMVAALRASVLVVLEAAVPTYACCGWGGPSDGRGGIEGRERTRGDVIGVVLEGDPWSPVGGRSGGEWDGGSRAGRTRATLRRHPQKVGAP
jgi:hypothetical protein